MKRILILVDDLSMKTKLLILFLLFSMVLVLGVGISSFKSSSEVIDSQTASYTESILLQIKDRVDEMRDEVLKVSIPIVLRKNIQSNDLKSLDVIDYISVKNSISSELALTMFLRKYICSIYICNENGIIISSEPVNEDDETYFKDYMVYRTAIDYSPKPTWTEIHKNEFQMDRNRQVFSMVRSLYDKETFKSFGALIVNIPASVLDIICGGSKDYNILIADCNGNIVYSKPDSLSLSDGNRTYLKEIAEGRIQRGMHSWDHEKEQYKVQYLVSDRSDWIYIAEVPVRYLHQNSNQVRSTITIILIVAILMSVAAAYMISSYFTTPLRKMIKTMKKVQSGDFNIRLDIKNRSESGQLAENYVVMVNKIRELIEDIKRKSLEKREAEINILQAQITPHFLYNVLNSIKCMARVQNATSISGMTESLIGLLQLSISRKTVFITVAEELEIIQKYVTLQNFRFGNKVSVEFDCPEEVRRYMVLKMTLQPLVENAILHGLEPKPGLGKILIRAYTDGKGLYLEVEDNGVGMDQDRIKKIMSGDWKSDKRFNGIGVKNIHDRIAMYFGPEYGICFQSIPGEFTKALVSIPLLDGNEVSHYL